MPTETITQAPKTTAAETKKAQLESFAKSLPYPTTPTNIPGVYAMTKMPTRDEIATAGSVTLLRRGIPFRKPGPNDRPALHATWKSIYEREKPLELIVPRLEQRPGKRHLGRRNTNAPSSGILAQNNWGGAVVDSSSTTGTWQSVTGQFNVPTVSKPTEPGFINGGWQSSLWVGIDGYSEPSKPSNDVLQIGVECDVDSKGNATYSAWFEWAVTNASLTGGVTSISTGRVTPGDTTPMSPSLASIGGNLYLAWRGDGNSNLNVMLSPDGGTSFHQPPLVTADTSAAAPAICSMNNNLYLAWKGNGNDNLNVAQVVLDGNGLPTGLTNKVTLGDTSQSGPALCGLDGMLYLAWRGEGNDHICIMRSSDGVNWSNQHVSSENTPATPALGICNGQLFVAWRGDGNENLNVGAVALDNSKAPTSITNINVLGITSPQNPSLAGVDGFLYLSFMGDNGDELYVFVSADEGKTFPVGHSSSQTTPNGPAMAAVNSQMVLAWRGNDNDLINVAPILTNFNTLGYTPVEMTILNFAVNPGDSMTASCNYNGTTSGVVQMSNNTTGQAFSLTLAPPPGANFNGKCVEWIMETPRFSAGLSALPSFTTITFGNAFGCSVGDTSIANPSSCVSPIPEVVNAAGNQMTNTTLGDDALTITFAG